jgi:cephalosporin-C deacetylase
MESSRLDSPMSAVLALVWLLVCAALQAAQPEDAPARVQEIDAFWAKTLERARKEPLEAQVEPVLEPLPFYKFRVTYRSLDGVKVRALLGLPIAGESAAGRRFPAIVTAPGYGGTEQGAMLADCQRGYVVLQVYPRGQGESASLWPLGGRDKLTWNVERPEGYYYQGAYVDVIRAIDYLVSRPDVDPDRLGAMGTSQGGGIVLAVASLDTRIRAVTAHVPFLCNLRQSAQIDEAIARKLLLRHNALTPAKLRTLDFFDPVNLVRRLKAPVLMSAGGKDGGCPASSIRSVFDNATGIKSLVYYPDLPHTSCSDFYKMSWEWLGRHLGN